MSDETSPSPSGVHRTTLHDEGRADARGPNLCLDVRAQGRIPSSVGGKVVARDLAGHARQRLPSSDVVQSSAGDVSTNPYIFISAWEVTD